MTRAIWSEIKGGKVREMTKAERAEYEQGYAEAKFAAEVGDHVRQAREAAGFSQRELASRMGTSQAAVAPRSGRCRCNAHHTATRGSSTRPQNFASTFNARVEVEPEHVLERVVERVTPARA